MNVHMIYIIPNDQVTCSDLEGLVRTTLEERGTDPEDVNVFMGLDDGQGILKVIS